MNHLHRGLTIGVLCSGVLIAPLAMAQMGNYGNRCPGNASGSPVGAPLPEAANSPVALVTPANGTVDVKLNNTTNATVSYQAIGHTSPRILAGGQAETLRRLPLPVTLTLTREDGGLLKVQPIESSSGTLEVNLDEETRFDNVQGTIRIQRNGQVYLY